VARDESDDGILLVSSFLIRQMPTANPDLASELLLILDFREIANGALQ